MKMFKQVQKHRLVGIALAVMIALAFGGCDDPTGSDKDNKSSNTGGTIQSDAGAKQLTRDIYSMMYYFFESNLENNKEYGNWPFNGQTGTVTVTGTKTRSPYGSYNYSYMTNVSLVFSDFSTNSNLKLISGSGSYYYWYRTSDYSTERRNEGKITLNSCGFSYIYGGKTYTGTVSIDLNFERITSLFYKGTITINGQSFNLYFS